MPSTMTEQFATWLIVSFVIDPRNNYTWWDSPNNAATRAAFKQAVQEEASPGHGRAGMDYPGDPRVLEANELADWTMVMRMLGAASRAYYR